MSTATMTDIRELCGLGLNWQLVVPTLLHMLHELVPSRFNIFFWVDDHFEISNAYAEFGPLGEAMHAYLERFYNRREAEVRPRFSDALRAESGVADWEQHYHTDQFLTSDFYREVFEPAGIRYTLRAYIPVDGHNGGLLILNRAVSDAPFSHLEKNALADVIPYVSTGMSPAHRLQPRTYATVSSQTRLTGAEAGALILNQHGQVLNGSPRGRYLLFLVTHPVINAATIKSCDKIDVPSDFQTIYNHTTDAYHRKLIEPYTFQLSNAWGCFSFCAHLLDGEPELPIRLSVSVQHHELVQMKMLRAMGCMALSPGQKRVSLLLLEGLHYAEIAEIMRISPATVKEYVHAVYHKLQVHSHHELIEKILANPMQ